MPTTHTFLTDEDEKKYVKSVNGVTPDENGNVVVNSNSGGDGLTSAEKTLILTLFRNAAYTADDMGSILAQLENLWSGDGDETEKTLTSISATYSGGDVVVGTAVSALIGIVVTATYSDGSTETVTGYTLSGEIAEGSNTITVSYGGKTTTFTVTGVAESSDGTSSVTTLSLCVNDGYLDTDGVTVKSQNLSFHSNNIDVSTIQSVKTKYRIAFIGYNFSPFLFYDADGAFLSGATGVATEADTAQYNYYEITESDIPDNAKYLKVVLIHQSGAKDLDTLMTVYK